MKFILKTDGLLYKKYDFILILSPSAREYNDLFLPPENYCTELDFEFINDFIAMVNKKHKKEYINMLIVIDDLIANVAKSRRETNLYSLIFNRRHLLLNGMISILITTQKYMMLPTAIRSNITLLISYQLNNLDWDSIYQELVRIDYKVFKATLKEIFQTPTDFMLYRIDNNTFFKKFKQIMLEIDNP